MTDTIAIKAAPGRRVRHEDGQLLAEAGETVPRTPWWIRRLDDEDVMLVEDKPRAKGRSAQGEAA
jgi:hypothetical protein